MLLKFLSKNFKFSTQNFELKKKQLKPIKDFFEKKRLQSSKDFFGKFFDGFFDGFFAGFFEKAFLENTEEK